MVRLVAPRRLRTCDREGRGQGGKSLSLEVGRQDDLPYLRGIVTRIGRPAGLPAYFNGKTFVEATGPQDLVDSRRPHLLEHFQVDASCDFILQAKLESLEGSAPHVAHEGEDLADLVA
jgi:hypothetical protein